MTNLQKATTLISDILDLKLGVGDIVESLVHNWEGTVLDVGGVSALTTCSTWRIRLKDLKLKQRNITLPMVLEAMILSKKVDSFSFYQTFDSKNIMVQKDGGVLKSYWQPRKDNRDCSLFDQKNEKLYKFILKVLK